MYMSLSNWLRRSRGCSAADQRASAATDAVKPVQQDQEELRTRGQVELARAR